VGIFLVTEFVEDGLSPITSEAAGYPGSGSFLGEERRDRGSGANSDHVWTRRFHATSVGKVLIEAYTTYDTDPSTEGVTTSYEYCEIDIVE